MAWGINGTPYTVTSAEDAMAIADLVPYQFQMFMVHTIQTGAGDALPPTRFNDDTGTNYARRRIHNFGTDTTGTSQNYGYWYGSVSSQNIFLVLFNMNIAGEEKLSMGWENIEWTEGAGFAPSSEEGVYKWANTSSQINDVDFINLGAGDYAIDSNVSCIGTD